MYQFKDSTRQRLTRVFQGGTALVDELERSVLLWRCLVEGEKKRPEESPASRSELQRVKKAAEKMLAAIAEFYTDGPYHLGILLLVSGHSPMPTPEFVREALEQAPQQDRDLAKKEHPDSELDCRLLYLAQTLQSAEQRRAGGRPVEFFEALTHDLVALVDSIDDLLVKNRDGDDAKERIRRAIAQSVARHMQAHGVQPTTERDGVFATALRLCLDEVGVSAPADLTSLAKVTLRVLDQNPAQ